MNPNDGGQGRLLEELQRDFPLVGRPFRAIARRCALSESAVLESTDGLLRDGLIREISALLDGRRLGYKTTLVAACAGDRAEQLAERVNRHPGVSHNYLREHDWNLWFTLAVPANRDFAVELESLLAGEAAPVMILPALRTFKLQVHLSFAEQPPCRRAKPAGVRLPPGQPAAPVAALTPFERELLARLEQPLPVVSRPWARIAADLETSQRRLLNTVRSLKRAGVVRRIAAVLRHRSAGYRANAMLCFDVPPERIVQAGEQAALLPAVSHCYERATKPGWPYCLYAMVHARSRAQCDALVREVAGRVGDCEYQLLYSLREYKKQRTKYFGATS